MINLLSSNKINFNNKLSSRNTNPFVNFVFKRSMFTSRGFLAVQTNNLIKRHTFPPMRFYKAVNYIEPHNLRSEDNKPLTQHEITHTIIASDDLKKALAILTSAKKPKHDFKPEVISNINYKGENKDQAIAPFKTPRGISAEFIKENPNITKYIEAKEAVLDQLLQNVKKIKCIKIVHKSYFDTPKDEEIFT